jgi:hypothetical protein
MFTLQITTNNQPRELISAFELNTAQHKELRKQFDYLSDEEFDCAMFFNYKGETYCLSDFIRIYSGDLLVKGWQGMHSWCASAGLLVKIVDSCQSVIVGSYIC